MVQPAGVESPRVESTDVDYSVQVRNLTKCYRIGHRRPRFVPRVGVTALRACRLLPARHETKDVWALRDVSFTVARGTILGIIGPAGAGKTTLLRILARITLPTSGRVIGRGRVVPLLGVENVLNGDRSGRDNIMLCAALCGIPRVQIQRHVRDVIEFAGMGDVIDMPLRHLSSEMRLRLAFSVVMQAQPDILLADEVVALVDEEFRERFVARLREASTSGTTTLIISKDVATIARMCHQVLWMDAGRTVQYGEPATVVSEYQRRRPEIGASRNGGVKKGLRG